ncbi:DUF4956 domain-containing protein [Streptococcus ovuberis]|uniref:DUF4956 domain-containing protein n=1 Tax=Streptococcus ovuberis TaxID=1936207 RepID=A0A7X6N1W1_9STRE|nr:DUF4956 domain-containing protein [Streptococcus ovuberis]NKZ20589.1 DUF4956 domain-containing protein [Streptococcus ovuberis]
MLDQMFQSVLSSSTVSVNPVWLLACLLTSLALGFILTSLYKHDGNYSKDFALTLVVLPALIAVIIFLVNGNLGTSVAVAGAFSLIKFRSPASSSKELLLVFMATAVGLATGMGYLLLAILMAMVIGGVLLTLEKSAFIHQAANWQEITICLPQTDPDRREVEDFVAHLGRSPSLETVKSGQGQLELTYRVLTGLSDQALLDHLLLIQPSWTVKLSRRLKKKKSL